MGDIEAGRNTNVFILIATAVFVCVILHILFKIIFGSKKKEAVEHETETNQSKFCIIYNISLKYNNF